MALKVPVKLNRIHNLLVDNGAGRAVAAPVGILRLREEADVVAFARDQEGDLRVDLQVLASLCGQMRSRQAVATQDLLLRRGNSVNSHISAGSNHITCAENIPMSITFWNSPSDTPSTTPVSQYARLCIQHRHTAVKYDALRLRGGLLLCTPTVAYIHLQHSLVTTC